MHVLKKYQVLKIMYYGSFFEKSQIRWGFVVMVFFQNKVS